MEEGKYEWSGLQERGDCSLRIRSADINYDDGENLKKTFNLTHIAAKNMPDINFPLKKQKSLTRIEQ